MTRPVRRVYFNTPSDFAQGIEMGRRYVAEEEQGVVYANNQVRYEHMLMEATIIADSGYCASPTVVASQALRTYKAIISASYGKGARDAGQ